jgi:mRNA-degrading endonuclease RelE of RelBE toxin-antitoxin system
MPNYVVKIDLDAFQDIQKATDWYNEQVPELGSRFQKQVKQQINSLKTNAQNYGIRYKNVRCMIIKKFPFLVHYTIENSTKTVNVFAVIHMSRNPTIWEKKRKL